MTRSLEDVLTGAGSIVELLRNQQTGPNVYPGVPAEYTNWRDEQWGWQHSAVLFNQSYHMVDLEVTGPDAFAMLNYLGINSFKGFTVDKAKQFIPVTPEGYVIGDVILFYLAEETFNLVGRAPVIEWVEYHAATGDWDVEVVRDERTALRSDRQAQELPLPGPGPQCLQDHGEGDRHRGAAAQVLQHDHARDRRQAGPRAAPRHGRPARIRAVRPVGGLCRGPCRAGRGGQGVRPAPRRRPRLFVEHARIGLDPSPLPGYYTGEGSKGFRAWAGENSYGAKASVGGSFVSERIEDYYLTPWDLGYGPFVKFDHDFVGREALEAMSGNAHRVKVTLALDTEDVLRAISSNFQKGDRAKFFEFPSAVYSMHPFDSVLADGRTVGVSTWIGYSSNEGKMLTLAMVEPDYAEPGRQVTLLWGEPDGGTRKLTVEPHHPDGDPRDRQPGSLFGSRARRLCG